MEAHLRPRRVGYAVQLRPGSLGRIGAGLLLLALAGCYYPAPGPAYGSGPVGYPAPGYVTHGYVAPGYVGDHRGGGYDDEHHHHDD